MDSDFFQAVFKSSASAMMVFDRSGALVALNPSAERISGQSSGSCVGRKMADIPFLAGCADDFRKALDSGEVRRTRISPRFGEAEIPLQLDVILSPLPGNQSEISGVIVEIEDTTERAKKDEHVRWAQKMDMVGTLAAGLAHDFNNVINGIKANVSSVKYSLAQERNCPESLRSSLEGDLEIIEESAARGADIVEQLLSLSKKKELPLRPTDLNEIADEAARICRRTLPRGVEISVSLHPGKAMISAYSSQIEQAVMNLLINAGHAMTIMKGDGGVKGGTAVVSVKKIYVGTNMCAVIPEAKVGYYWLLSVCDEGIGMTRDVMARIFEPFFTTKAPGRGSGLGLSMVYSIARRHGGFVDVFSKPGEGSTFFVFLPVLEAAGE